MILINDICFLRSLSPFNPPRLMTREGGVIIAQNPASIDYWGDLRRPLVSGPMESTPTSAPPSGPVIKGEAAPPSGTVIKGQAVERSTDPTSSSVPHQTPTSASAPGRASTIVAASSTSAINLQDTFLSHLFQLEAQLFPEFVEDISTGFEWQGVLRVPQGLSAGQRTTPQASQRAATPSQSASQLPDTSLHPREGPQGADLPEPQQMLQQMLSAADEAKAKDSNPFLPPDGPRSSGMVGQVILRQQQEGAGESQIPLGAASLTDNSAPLTGGASSPGRGRA